MESDLIEEIKEIEIKVEEETNVRVVEWEQVENRPTNVGDFNNDKNYQNAEQVDNKITEYIGEINKVLSELTTIGGV